MRIQVTEEDVADAIRLITDALDSTVSKKGDGAFASPAETLGVITEEYHELILAVKNNDAVNFKEELADIAVSCIWAIASKNAFNRIKKSEKAE